MRYIQGFQLLAMAFGVSSFIAAAAPQAQHASANAATPAVRHAAVARSRPLSGTVAIAPRAANRASTPFASRMHPRVSTNNFFSASGPFDVFDPFGVQGFGLGGFGLLNPDWGIKAAIDPATQWRLFEAQKFLRSGGFIGSGFYLWDGGYYEAPPDSGEIEQPPAQPQPQQPIVIVQAPQPGQPAAGPAPSEPEETSAPLTDVGQFVLVLKNGKQIETVAFAQVGDRLVYVTSDGSRRSLALADLDSAATIRINEERGTPLRLPL